MFGEDSFKKVIIFSVCSGWEKKADTRNAFDLRLVTC